MSNEANKREVIRSSWHGRKRRGVEKPAQRDPDYCILSGC